MQRTLTERKVLKKLGIPDFRHMTKDRVVKFASMLPKMDPEVAKKALDQFPEFASSVKEIVSYFKETIDKGIEANNESVQSFYRTCDNIISILEKQLEDGDLSFEEKNIIIDKMITLAEMKSAKDTENKKLIMNIAKIGGGALFGAAAVLAAVLGLQTDTAILPHHDESDDEIIDAEFSSC